MTITGTPPAWSALPPAMRGQAYAYARFGQPHPHPAVRAAVVAEWGRRREFSLRLASTAMLLFPLVMFPPLVSLGLLRADSANGWAWAGVLAGFGLSLLASGVMLVSGGYNLALLGTRRLESLNLTLALADRRQPATAPYTAHARGLRQPVVAMFGLLLALPVFAGVFGAVVAPDHGKARWAIPLAAAVLVTIPMALLAALAVQLVPFRGVVAEFTLDGVRLPALGLSLGWPEVAGVDAVLFQQTLCVAVVPRDPRAVAGQVGGPLLRRTLARWQLRKSGAVHLTPAWTREPIDEIVAGAQALHLAAWAGAAG